MKCLSQTPDLLLIYLMKSSRFIEPEKYPQKIYFLEYILPLTASAGSLIGIRPLQLIFLYSIILGLKYRVEGFRINFPLLFPPILASLTPYKKLTLLLSAVSALSTYFLIVYKLPKSKAMIGCQKIQEDNTFFSLFYPTLASKSMESTPLFNQDAGSRMFDVINKDPGSPSKIPKKFIDISSGHYSKLKTENIILNAPCIQRQYQLMVVSHQLGFNTSYAFAQQFVEAGYLVLLLDHPELIRNIHPDPQSPINKQFRKGQLLDRYKAAGKALDYILDDANVTRLFGENVKIDKSNVHMLGHSFGGTTTLYTAVNDRRITGCVLCYDPCFYILEDDYTLFYQELSLQNKILILLADDYYSKHYPFFQNCYRAKMFKNNCANSRVLRMRGVSHANYSDLSLFSAGQFHRFNVVQNHNMRLYFEMTLALSHMTLNNPEFGTEEQLIETLIAENQKYKGEISSTFRSISSEFHQRLNE